MCLNSQLQKNLKEPTFPPGLHQDTSAARPSMTPTSEDHPNASSTDVDLRERLRPAELAIRTHEVFPEGSLEKGLFQMSHEPHCSSCVCVWGGSLSSRLVSCLVCDLTVMTCNPEINLLLYSTRPGSDYRL